MTRRKRDADSAQLLRRQTVTLHLFPMFAAIMRTIKPAARTIRRRINAPRRPSRLPKRRVQGPRVARLERQINRTGVLVVKEYAFPAFAAVVGTIHAAFVVRSVGVRQSGNKDAIRILRIDQYAADLPRIAQPDVRPGFPGV